MTQKITEKSLLSFAVPEIFLRHLLEVIEFLKNQDVILCFSDSKHKISQLVTQKGNNTYKNLMLDKENPLINSFVMF